MKKALFTTLALALTVIPLAACAEAPPVSEETPPPVEAPTPPIETPDVPDTPTSPVPDPPIEPSEPSIPPVEEPIAPAPPTEEPVAPTPPTEEPIAPAPPAQTQARYILILKDNLNIRTGAGTSYASLGQLEKGTLLELVKTENGWHQTHYKNRVAYVSASTSYTKPLSLNKTDDKTEEVIARGLKFMGVPYVYGAVRYHDGEGNKLKNFTAHKFDCSSLMQYIFYLGADTLLGTTTRTQILQGERVKGEVERGDLLFFTNDTRYYNTGIERVGHVALYLGGNYILHTASDFAKIEQVSAKRWSYYLEARRFF